MPKRNYISLRTPVRVIGPSIAYVELTQNFFAVIDAEDAERVGKHTWSARKGSRTRYAVAKINGKIEALHIFLLNFPDSHIDHKNTNGLHNWKTNLRLANKQQNAINRAIRTDSTNKFKGVYPRNGRWQAVLCNKHIGMFDTSEEAHAAYCQRARELFGEFANDGFMTQP